MNEVIVNSRAGLSAGSTFHRKGFGIKIYKLCDESGYIFDMRVYLSRDSHSATDDMTVTHAAIRHLTCRVEGLGHKIFMDNLFLSPIFLMTWKDIK